MSNIKNNLSKLNNLIKQEKTADKKTIYKLQNQLNIINKNISKIVNMSNKIKNGRLKSQKGGNCAYLKKIVIKKNKNKKGGKITCQASVSQKIKRNIKEFEKGRYKSPAQAIAVSYSEISRERPGCKRVLKK